MKKFRLPVTVTKIGAVMAGGCEDPDGPAMATPMT